MVESEPLHRHERVVHRDEQTSVGRSFGQPRTRGGINQDPRAGGRTQRLTPRFHGSPGD